MYEKLFEKHVSSSGGDLFKLKKECEIQRQIATAWEKAGNTRKATKMREDADTRQSRAEGQYTTEDYTLSLSPGIKHPWPDFLARGAC